MFELNGMELDQVGGAGPLADQGNALIGLGTAVGGVAAAAALIPGGQVPALIAGANGALLGLFGAGLRVADSLGF
jgi:hypothetical protein